MAGEQKSLKSSKTKSAQTFFGGEMVCWWRKKNGKKRMMRTSKRRNGELGSFFLIFSQIT